ncbi:hypothetical protein KGQ24_02595 [Patescibacteria group bacterium]|nr:hypothetical protein [Patescibacteria group bacterium]
MQAEQLEQIRASIGRSSLLSAVERAEWLQLMDEMTDQQLHELMDILSPAKPKAMPAAQAQHGRATSPPFPPKVDIKEKELPPGIPFYEPEIPAHAGMVKPAAPLQQPAPAPVDPSALQRKVENLAKHSAPENTQPPAPEPPQQTAHHFAEPKPSSGPAETIALRTPEDFARLTAAHLHGADPKEELQKVFDSMVVLGKKSEIYEIISNFEKSPLYKTYIEMGIELLNDSDPDRDQAYQTVETAMQKSRRDFLTKEEFEAFADFRNKVEDLL